MQLSGFWSTCRMARDYWFLFKSLMVFLWNVTECHTVLRMFGCEISL
jgi:hypothetical protein